MLKDTLYYKDPYIKVFKATVLSCEKDKDNYLVILDNTAFYPEGGGQASDKGLIDGKEVIDVKERGNKIIHYLKEEIKVNKEVECVLDFEHRFIHMQSHTAEHIVSGLIHKHFGYDNVSFHMGEVIQIDFNGPLSSDDILMIEDEANKVIYKNIDIETLWPDINELDDLEYRSKLDLKDDVRIIKISDIDMCACCGTHVSKTGEIGIIKILSSSKHKDGVRLEMLAGKRCFEYLRDIYEENHKISVMLSAEMNKTSEYVYKLKEDYKNKEFDYLKYMERYLDNAESINLKDGVLCYFEENIDKNIIKKFTKKILDKDDVHTVFFINSNNGKNDYLFMSKQMDLKAIVKVLNEELKGKGGGGIDIAQGYFESDKEAIVKALKEIVNNSIYYYD